MGFFLLSRLGSPEFTGEFWACVGFVRSDAASSLGLGRNFPPKRFDDIALRVDVVASTALDSCNAAVPEVLVVPECRLVTTAVQQ
mmetsp:Transcript_4471/g.11214  ORF Transcript_4471/g.11214 Transcript_4471/m.11214 type:complete len:85 (+) Transcript_4471:982-1236(+)